MGDGKSRSDIVIAGIAVAFFISFAFFGAVTLTAYQERHADERVSAAEYQADNSAKQGESLCVEVPRQRTHACVTEPPETNPDTEYTKSDLHAQQEMAEWAYAMFLATLAGVLITAVGLIYVVRAFRLNAEATEQARIAAKAASDQAKTASDAFTAERRPWLAVSVVSVGHTQNGNFVLRLEVKNVGLGVAVNFRVIAPDEPWLRPSNSWTGQHLRRLQDAIDTARATSEHVGMALFPQQPHTEDLVISYSGHDSQYVAGYVRYYSPADADPETVHITPFLWMIQVDSDLLGRPVGATAAPFINNITPN